MSLNKFYRGFPFFWTWVGLGVLIGLLFPAAGQGATPLRIVEQDIAEGRKTIVVQAASIPLIQLLKEIETRSGISFDLNEGLEEDLLTIDTRGSNWTSLVLGVLKDYNQVHVWASPSRLKRVYLLNPLDGSDLQQTIIDQHKKKRVVPSQNSVLDKNPALELSEAQLRQVASGKHRSPIPLEMFDDPQIRVFLDKNGMKTLEDRNNLRLSMKVRSKARKALMFLRRKKNIQGR